jgi:hypothetical protein
MEKLFAIVFNPPLQYGKLDILKKATSAWAEKIIKLMLPK